MARPDVVVTLECAELNVGDLGPDGAQLRPHIVWFGEAVPMIDAAMDVVTSADVVVVVGTSSIYPAAGLVGHAPQHAPIWWILTPRWKGWTRSCTAVGRWRD